WVVAKQRFAGVLWWCINYWRGNPYENATPEPVETPGGRMYSYTPGNGSMLYPNPAGEGPPVDSLRWEQFREGMEEAELLLALTRARAEVAAKLGDPSFDAHRHTRELAGLVAASVADYDPDAAHFEAARAQLAYELRTTGAAPLMLCHLDPLTDGPTTREQLQVVGLAADGASVSVAGKPAVRQGRAFTANVALAVGRNRIPVVARAGKATKTVTLTAVRTTALLEQLRSLFADMQRWGPDLSALRGQLESLVDAGKYADAQGQGLLRQARASLHDWIAGRTVLPQGSFEDGLKGWNNAGDIACTVSDTAFSGAHSLQVRDDSRDKMIQYFSDLLPAQPGQDYLLVGSGLVKAATGARNHTFRVSIQFFAGGKYLGGCERALFWNQRNDDWETQSVHATAPADADHLRATVVSYKENVGEALLDDLAIVAVDR
ncbi:MAG: DUF4091 domain-containing protein, partial [Armatimonadetes bacterium]|nr:DUF4091 domain-containing protein [Armatimonadota bacterium]